MPNPSKPPRVCSFLAVFVREARCVGRAKPSVGATAKTVTAGTPRSRRAVARWPTRVTRSTMYIYSQPNTLSILPFPVLHSAPLSALTSSRAYIPKPCMVFVGGNGAAGKPCASPRGREWARQDRAATSFMYCFVSYVSSFVSLSSCPLRLFTMSCLQLVLFRTVLILDHLRLSPQSREYRL
ncbi:hypothetical protein BD413DRAFT_594278, partial [Trametes elegans]